MKKCLMLLLITAGLSFPYYNAAAENDNCNVRMSCTIPAIPGVNTPLIKESAQPAVLKETKSNTPLMLQKETRETRQIEGRNLAIKVATIYSR